MKNNKFEELIPEEIISETSQSGICYLPIGSMEWHGPHMGMGVDTLHAYEISLRTSKKTGGVVFPPLFIGTENERSSSVLKNLGFSGNEKIVGMDFPNNSIKSFYWPEDLFEAIIRAQTEMTRRLGFKLIVFTNGHMAESQMEILEKISAELSDAACKIVVLNVLFTESFPQTGHAGLAETAIMMNIAPDSVKLDKLPERSTPLQNVDFAIVDNDSFLGKRGHDFTVHFDPRDASAELGERIIEAEVKKCVDLVLAARNMIA
jgi:creatinine amidohydrolase